MNIILTHKTAVRYYRYFRSIRLKTLDSDLSLMQKLIIPKYFNKNIKYQIEQTSLNHFDEIYPELLIYDRNKANRYSSCVVRHTDLKYPKNSFRKIEDELYIPTPELLFYQMSNELNIPDLLLFGFEMCGTYTLQNNKNELITDIKPISSSKELVQYLNRLYKQNNKFCNIPKAIKAAKFISDNSFSPLESRLYILLCLKRSLGGFGLTGFKLNQQINLSNEGSKICFQKTVTPDLCNMKTKIAIEYDSSLFHDNVAQNQKDKLRMDAMIHDGWKVFTFVKAHTHNYEAFNQLANDILKANNQDVRCSSKRFLARRYELFNHLYNSW